MVSFIDIRPHGVVVKHQLVSFTSFTNSSIVAFRLLIVSSWSLIVLHWTIWNKNNTETTPNRVLIIRFVFFIFCFLWLYNMMINCIFLAQDMGGFLFFLCFFTQNTSVSFLIYILYWNWKYHIYIFILKSRDFLFFFVLEKSFIEPILSPILFRFFFFFLLWCNREFFWNDKKMKMYWKHRKNY